MQLERGTRDLIRRRAERLQITKLRSKLGPEFTLVFSIWLTQYNRTGPLGMCVYPAVSHSSATVVLAAGCDY